MTDPDGPVEPPRPPSRSGPGESPDLSLQPSSRPQPPPRPELRRPQAQPSPSEAPAEFVLANPHLPPTTTGFGSGGLAAGIGACVLGLVSCCWWPMAALPVAMGLGAMVLGYLGMKQVADSGGEVIGRSTAIGAVAAGAAGLVLTVVSLVIGLIVEANLGSVFG